MSWEVEFTDEFCEWWDGLTKDEQERVSASVMLLERYGPSLGYPHSSAVKTSRYAQMRELRIQHQGRPYRVLYAFDPRRIAILLIGGDKTGDKRWYEVWVPIADALYEQHLRELRKEGGCPMARKFSELRARMSPESRARSEELARTMIAEMPLQHVRAARELTQQNLAEVLGVNQGEISKIERRADMYVSTLRSYVQAMGGELEIRAVFPEGDSVRISQFEQLSDAARSESSAGGRLKRFLCGGMRMREAYQPWIILCLLRSGGSASLESMARSFPPRMVEPAKKLDIRKRLKFAVERVLVKHNVAHMLDSDVVVLNEWPIPPAEREPMEQLCESLMRAR